jgi:hypothetical protein
MELLLKNLQKELASLRAYAKKLEQQLGITTSSVPTPLGMSPTAENKIIESRKRDELSMNLNLSPRPGSAPGSGLRTRATSGMVFRLLFKFICKSRPTSFRPQIRFSTDHRFEPQCTAIRY